MTKAYEFERLKAIFNGDGSEIREQFILAGLLLTVFERFKTYVTYQVEGFFSSHIKIKDGEFHYTRGDKFKQLIKERGNYEPGQHANKQFRAAMKWFGDFGAITKNEIDAVERIYLLRNDIGHELFRVIADDDKDPIRVDDVFLLFGIYLKIVRWWVKEVEATTDPDFSQEKYDAINWDEVESSDTVFLRGIIHKTLAPQAADLM